MHGKEKLVFGIIMVGILSAQPKISAHLEMGLYSPELTGFKNSSLFPTPTSVTENILIGYGVSYQFYPNVRVGYASHNSFEIGNINTFPFTRTLTYREFSIESFYRPWKRIEFNFTLSPMYNSGTISMTTDATDQEWDNLLSDFGNPSSIVSRSDQMTTTWFGFTSSIGLRYHLFTWMSLESKIGFMENYYDETKWTFQGDTVTGPVLNLSNVPMITMRIIFGW
ncbi:MAG: hypothetical protein HN647_08025 [Candidatus Marinimicrobia bacterium]|jgi:hypothetical protein|nr:hypothetical protein [Candidatus Neomarinimicrobiota bacterium]MBT3618316.1 hypothetical protein [Candidatus Neomarinimicrobiota bacterium]MBT3828261.1 hypothetical protein [Candidatus Neomarinimicrobiota bacterium]MBT3997178.1 hypothetical protein [Candidatus Neomarinimicrobiota bacterium]MBT4796173.1 hypothetical protein [Candidatus Neomarinimicrobiota bacterium]